MISFDRDPRAPTPLLDPAPSRFRRPPTIRRVFSPVTEPTLTDEQLMRFVAQDESWALAELYDRYARLVFSLALKMLNDRASAEEIVQEVYAKLWRNAGAFSPNRGKFSSWLIGIAHHQCIDELRRRRVRPISEPVDESAANEFATEDD